MCLCFAVWECDWWVSTTSLKAANCHAICFFVCLPPPIYRDLQPPPTLAQREANLSPSLYNTNQVAAIFQQYPIGDRVNCRSKSFACVPNYLFPFVALPLLSVPREDKLLETKICFPSYSFRSASKWHIPAWRMTLTTSLPRSTTPTTSGCASSCSSRWELSSKPCI